MNRYADPQRCPGCQGTIAYGARSCPSCDLPLSGDLAGRLFATLAQADELLRALRASATSVVPAGAVVPTGPPMVPPLTMPTAPRPARGLSAASVPKILLGLGAGCLLVAALVFLAVTWSVMGVGGRTATLVGFTVLTGALAGWLAHRDLRAAAESLAVVALGLLAFDLFGARDAGWFGDISTSGFLVLLGGVLALTGAAAALAVRRTPAGALTGSEVVAALGVATICIGLNDADWFAFSATLTLSVVLAAGAGYAAHRVGLVALAVGSAVVSGGVWLILLASSLERAVDHPGAHELWLELEVWPLLVSALFVGAVAAARMFPVPVRVAGLATAELILAGTALVPFTQGSGTELTLAVLVVLAVACALTWFAGEPWSWACAVTAGVGGVWMTGVGSLLAATALGRVAEAGSFGWSGDLDGVLPATADLSLAPWLLPVAVAAVIATVIVVARAVRAVDPVVAPLANPVLGVALVAAAVVGTVASYPVPVWLVCALLLLPGAALVAWSVARTDGPALSLGALFLAVALAVSFYDEWLTAAALATTLLASTAVYLRWRQLQVSAGAGAVVATALAGSVWTWGALADAEGTWTAAAVLLVLAVLVLAVSPKLWRLKPATVAAQPRNDGGSTVGVEVGAAAAAFVFAVAGVDSAPLSQDATWTAVYLTLAGAAVSMVALLREDRRRLGWLGGLLLAMATWVRLSDIGVEEPEAYTLPSAVALLLVGILHLRRHPSASTTTALAAGLSLALVPSLLWVLWEPVTLRSLLLGAGCLLLLVGGVRIRWTAPVVFAATVGALVVLRHAGPFIDQAVPRWVLIATAGALLIGLGITWERRIQEARLAVGYVRALR